MSYEVLMNSLDKQMPEYSGINNWLIKKFFYESQTKVTNPEKILRYTCEEVFNEYTSMNNFNIVDILDKDSFTLKEESNDVFQLKTIRDKVSEQIDEIINDNEDKQSDIENQSQSERSYSIVPSLKKSSTATKSLINDNNIPTEINASINNNVTKKSAIVNDMNDLMLTNLIDSIQHDINNRDKFEVSSEPLLEEDIVFHYIHDKTYNEVTNKPYGYMGFANQIAKDHGFKQFIKINLIKKENKELFSITKGKKFKYAFNIICNKFNYLVNLKKIVHTLYENEELKKKPMIFHKIMLGTGIFSINKSAFIKTLNLIYESIKDTATNVVIHYDENNSLDIN